MWNQILLMSWAAIIVSTRYHIIWIHTVQCAVCTTLHSQKTILYKKSREKMVNMNDLNESYQRKLLSRTKGKWIIICLNCFQIRWFSFVPFRFASFSLSTLFSFFSAFNVLLFKMQCYVRIKFDYELKQSLHVSNYQRIYAQEVVFFERKKNHLFLGIFSEFILKENYFDRL